MLLATFALLTGPLQPQASVHLAGTLSLLHLISGFFYPHLIFIQEKNNKLLPLAHAGQISPTKNPGAKVTSKSLAGK